MAFCAAPHRFLFEIARTRPAARIRLHDENFPVLSDLMAVHAVLNGSTDDFEKAVVSGIPRASGATGIIRVEGDGRTELHRMFAPVFAR